MSAAPRATAAIRAIALNTFREAIRDRVLYLLLGFALVLIGAARLLSMLTVGDEDKIVKDVGLSAISFFGVLTAGFVGVSLVFKEIERKTVYTLLAQPLRRWQFVAGKFAGLVAVLAMMVGLMSVALAGLLLVRGVPPWPLLPAVALIFVELTVVTAFALLFSTVTRPILAAVSTFAVWVMGHLSWSLRLLEDELAPGPQRIVVEAFYWLLPHLDRLDVKSEVVHGIDLAPAFFPIAAAYGLGYAALVLVVACFAFERRDFT
jgi:ABC-type transport system involved in multi-copper enzyme maturation permease subunit